MFGSYVNLTPYILTTILFTHVKYPTTTLSKPEVNFGIKNRNPVKAKIHKLCLLAQVERYLYTQLVWNIVSKIEIRKTRNRTTS